MAVRRSSSTSSLTDEEEALSVFPGCNFAAVGDSALTPLSSLGTWQCPHDHVFLHALRGRRERDHANRRVEHAGAHAWRDLNLPMLERKAKTAAYWLANPGKVRDRYGPAYRSKIGTYKRVVLLLHIAREEVAREADADAKKKMAVAERGLALAREKDQRRGRLSKCSPTEAHLARNSPPPSRVDKFDLATKAWRREFEDTPRSPAAGQTPSLAVAMGLDGWL